MKPFKTPLLPIPKLNSNIRDRFWDNVELFHGITDEDCWLWKQKYANSRPKFGIGLKQYPASRIAYALHKGIPDNLLVCHTCDNDHCVNPSHLFLGDYFDNNRDMVSKGRHWSLKKTHCPKGHDYDEKNTQWIDGGKHRQCKACERIYKRLRRDRRIGISAIQ